MENSAAVVIMIMVPIMVAPALLAAAFTNFFELLTPLTRLLAMLAVLTLRLMQALFRLADILFAFAAVVAVSAGRRSCSHQQ